MDACKYLAVIPARGGSKGVPGKNIKDLNGKPLIAYTIEAAKASKYIDKIVVSTDCDEIASVSHEYCVNIIKRPIDIATDTSKVIDTVLHVLLHINAENVILLQPTSPLRKTIHIDEAIELYEETKASILSVHETKSPLFIRDKKNKPIIRQRSDIRRQDLEPYYMVNGAIYINKAVNIDKSTSLNDNDTAYIMDKLFSMDIDEALDFSIASLLLSL